MLEYSSQESIEAHNIFEYVKVSNPSFLHLDWDGASKWKELIGDKLSDSELAPICRLASFHFILKDQILLELVTYGREKLVSNLTDDEKQVFRNGALLEKIPSLEVVLWWDQIRIAGRNEFNHKLLSQGREAERWTMEFEISKTAHLGEEFIPQWVALESDHYGYDILSYRPNTQFAPLAILIEVKSFANPTFPHFYVTKTEWDKATETANNYIFFVWCISNKTYKVYTHTEIEKHIPTNNEGGNWQTVLITLDGWVQKQ